MKTDPVTAQIAANALASACDEMATTIFRTAHSTVVRDCLDFSTALANADGELVAQAVTVPLHLGSVPAAMSVLLAKYRAEMRPGDMFVMNDPFGGGMHLPDIFVFKPVFVASELVAFTTTTAHHADVGGRLSGSSACDNTDIFQEGLRLPWIHLYREGRPVHEVFAVIEANVRIPRMALGDLSAQVAACSVGERAMIALVERYGAARLASIMSDLLDYTESLVRAEIAAWPDGTAKFVDFMDSDGLEERAVPVAVKVTIKGDTFEADFTESAPMVRGALNCTRSFTQAAVYHAARCAMSGEIPYTAGAFRPIDVITKPGTIAEVVMPGASSARGVTGFRMIDAVNGALAQLIPERVPAAGEGGNTNAIFGMNSGGDHYIFFELPVGTWGATPVGDGNDGVGNLASTAANIPVEVAEAEFPIVIEQYGYVGDSGGAGRFRGGLAVERAWRCITEDASLVVRSDRRAHLPYGLAGGKSGQPSINIIRQPDGSERTLPPMISTTLFRDEVFYHRFPSGGGYGDPFERDPEAVLRDVRNEKVSRESALEKYGVVLDDRGEVDMVRSGELRAGFRRAKDDDAVE